MITQIEIDGFKTFKDFKVELAPFQVIVGPNGSGKSNLFDALQLISQSMIPGGNVYTAMKGIRGEAGELFTKYPDGTTSDTIRIAVEMLVDKKATFSDGREIDLKFARFRYELEIRAEKKEGSLYQRFTQKKNMMVLPIEQDNWCRRYNILPNTNIPQYDMALDKDIDSIVQKLLHGTKPEAVRTIKEVSEANIDIIKLYKDYSDINYIYANIVQEELRSLSFYQFDPEALRRRSSTSAPPYLARDGGNLPATLARIKAEDSTAFHFVSLDITGLVSDVLEVDVEKYNAIDEYGIRVTIPDKGTFTAQALSDGTLRLLALATLRNDPQFHGTICIEEPENGAEPHYLNELAVLLRDMATDFADPEQAGEPLRQVIVATHSPLFISQAEVIDHLLLTTMPTRVASQEKQPVLDITRMEPVMTPETLKTINLDADEDLAGKHYTIDIVRQYLDGGTLQQANERLKQARSNIRKKS